MENSSGPGWITTPQGAAHQIEARFHLTPEMVNHLERLRHANPKKALPLMVHINPTVVWLRNTGNDMGAALAGKQQRPGGLPQEYGLHSDLVQLWAIRADDIGFEVDATTWIEKVMRAFGQHRSRLIEIPFPDARHFTRAREALDAGRYEDAVGNCRPILAGWEVELDLPKGKRLASVVADQQGWAEDDPRRKALDKLWDGMQLLVNNARHEEHHDIPWTAADARASVLLTAVLSQYLTDLESSDGRG